MKESTRVKTTFSKLPQILSVVFLVLLIHTGFAQNSDPYRDSLKAVIAEKSDTARFLALHALSSSWINDSTPLARKIAFEALEYAEEINYRKGIAYTYSILGVVAYNEENYELAIENFKKCKEFSEGVMEPLKISFMVGNIGLMYESIGDYQNALKYSLECLKIRQGLTDTTHLAYAYYNTAELYKKLGKLREAIEYHEQALKLRQMVISEMDEFNVIEDSYCSIAEIKREQGEYQQALELYRKALALYYADEYKTRNWNKDDIMSSIGVLYQQQGKRDSAFYYLERALELSREKSGQQASSIGSRLLNLAQAHRQFGGLPKAESLLKEAAAITDTLEVLPLRSEISLEYSEVLETLGKYEASLIQLKIHKELQDSILNQDRISAIEEMKTRFETEKKESEIAQLSNEMELASVREKQQNVIMYAVIAVSVLLIVLVVIVLRNNRSKQRVNQVLAKKNTENEALLREIHHRVKNNLQVISSLLNLQSSSLSDEAALDAIKEGQNRVKSIALIHQKLYQTDDLSKVNFKEYVDQLISHLASAMQPRGKSIEKEVISDGIELDIDTAVPLGLIINELVTNSYKYAFEKQDIGRIQIRLERLDGDYHLTYQDNGIGFPEGFDLKKSKSLGMKLISILTRQLRGTINWRNEVGVHINIQFKEVIQVRKTA